MAIWLPKLDGRKGPKYLQIVEAIAEDIGSGRLSAGTKLPPYRDLSYDLNLSPNTVSRAYAEGVKRTLLRGETGRGTFVRVPRDPLDGGAVGDLTREASGPIDLSRNLPIAGLAEPHFRRILGELERSNTLPSLLDYQTDADLAHHADAALIWLTQCGIDAAAEAVVHTTGAQHGLFCALTALLAPGDLLLTEALSYAPVRVIAERLGIRTQPVLLDDEGLCPDAFEKACKSGNPKALYLTPTLQSPTTATLSMDRRRAIAEIAKRHDILIIEDDVFGLLKPDRPEPIFTQAPERTVYLTSISKCIAPGLRVGYVLAPMHLAPALRQAVNLSIWMTPPLTAEIVARMICDGAADELIGGQRAAAAARQSIARSVLGSQDVLSDPHGLHLWLKLPSHLAADMFCAEAARRDVLITEACDFAERKTDAPNAVRLCLSHERSESRLKVGLKKIADLLDIPTMAHGLFL